MKNRKVAAMAIIISLLISTVFQGQVIQAAEVGSVEASGLQTDSIADELFPYRHETNGGFGSSNVSRNGYDTTYRRYARPVYSTLSQNVDGSFIRVEADTINGNIYAENYSSAFDFLTSTKIERELPIYGGCFIGSEANYLVFGQYNPKEDDEVEVVRIVKYDKSWNRISSVSMKGANTETPFYAGSLRMTESGGRLFIHTCHQMYGSDDGYQHQANMTITIDEDSMEIIQSRIDSESSINYGYVSHSLNQYIVTDGTYLYRLDHGDAAPRAVVLIKDSIDNFTSNTITPSSSRNILNIQDSLGNSNDTGVEVGGLALAGDYLVTAGDSIDQDEEIFSNSEFSTGMRNIYVTSTDTGLGDTEFRWLTSYDEDDVGTEIVVGSPHLVKVSDESLYVLWEEEDYESDQGTILKIAGINAKGEKLTETYTLFARLSDCAPIVTGENEITWYVTYGRAPVFYQVDLNNLGNYRQDTVDLSECEVIFDQEVYEYNPNGCIPEITIKYKNYVLKEGEDYKIVSYGNHANIGTAYVLIEATGAAFTGTVRKEYTIGAVDMSKYSVVFEPESLVYTGYFQRPAHWTFYKGEEECWFSSTEIDYVFSEDSIDVGTYEVKFTPKLYGHTGYFTGTYTIEPRDINETDVSLETNRFVYDGNAKTPAVQIKMDNIIFPLEEGKDYTVDYQNNVAIGTAYVVINGIGNYTGTMKVPFEIVADTESGTDDPDDPTRKYNVTFRYPETVTSISFKNDAYTLASNKISVPAETEVSFKPEIADGYRIVSVKLGGTDGKRVEADENGYYAITVTSDMEIIISTTAIGDNPDNPDDPDNPNDPDDPINPGDQEKGIHIVGLKESYDYTGSKIVPDFSVMDYDVDGTKPLASGVDYTVKYKNNTKVGTAQITVTSKGNYTGKETVTFNISPLDIGQDDGSGSGTIFEADDMSIAYNGKAQKPIPVLFWNGKKLKNNTDYTTEYYDSTGQKLDSVKDVAEYTIELHGKGNFSGTRRLRLSVINKENLKLTSKLSVAKIPNQSYQSYGNGIVIPSGITVKDGKTTLTENVHYKLSYSNNTKVGTAYVIIEGIEENGYSGIKRVSFKITGIAIKKATVTGLSGKEFIYSGVDIKPDLTLTIKINGEEKILKRYIDYDVAWKSNQNAGKATAVITGLGGYTGTVKKTFKIQKFDVAANTGERFKVTLENDSVPYAKGGAKPAPEVIFKKEDGTIQKLEAGKDYTLSYKNNTAVNDGNNPDKMPTVTIKGKGSFNGTYTTKPTYKITPQDIGNLTISATDKTYQNKKNNYAAKVTITDLNGKTLKAGTDYDKTFTYKYISRAELADGTIRKLQDVVEKDDIIPAGTILEVTIHSKGNNYTGLIKGEYRITQASISGASVSVPKQTYTGQAIKLSEDQITVKVKGKKLDPDQYEIVPESYKDNTNKGTASVTIKGIGNYGGTKTVKFTIGAKGFLWW